MLTWSIGVIVYFLIGADVEAVPAETEDERPEDGEGHRVTGDNVRRPVLVVAIHPGPEDPRGREAGDTAHAVDDHAAREVTEPDAQNRREEAATPSQSRHDGVDDRREDDGVRDVRAELRTAGDGPTDDGRRRHGEHGAEEPADPDVGAAGDVAERVRTATDYAGDAGTDQEVDDDADAPSQHVLGQLVRHVLRAYLPRLQHGEAGVHEEDQEGDGEHPDVVYARGERRRIDLERRQHTLTSLRDDSWSVLGQMFVLWDDWCMLVLRIAIERTVTTQYKDWRLQMNE